MLSLVRKSARKLVDRKWVSFYAPESILSAENRRKTVEKFAKLKPIKQHAHVPTRKAAVLIPLCIIDRKVALLYTLRATNLKTHRGQVSFPGGMHDPSDTSLEMTALRETEEELGIGTNDIDIWGRGNYVVTAGQRITGVLPIIGQIKRENIVDELRKVNPQEVSEVFVVTLEDLCDPRKNGHTQFRNGYSMPIFFGGKLRIWGLTALITHYFLQSLLPRELYNHPVTHISQVKLTLPYRY